MAPCWTLDGPYLQIASVLLVSFQRTRQITDLRDSLQPKSYGALPLFRDPCEGEPARVLVPLGSGEAVWLGLRTFMAAPAIALRVAVEEPVLVDAVTGGPWSETLLGPPQSYVVCPPQESLDGVQLGASRARQFARIPSSEHAVACRRLKLVGLPPASAMPRRELPAKATHRLQALPHGTEGDDDRSKNETGVFQQILPDPYGLGTWSNDRRCQIVIDFVSPDDYSSATGEPLLPHLDSVSTYGGWRLP